MSSPLAEISIHTIGSATNSVLEISTGNPLLFQDFYAFCCTLADRVQIDREPVDSALQTTLAAWAALLRRKTLLGAEAQVGLFAELVFLERVAKVIGWAPAVDAWQGPKSEEHDFTLPFTDAEVKATRSEKRIHRISSLTQLLPKHDRRLLIASVQLTEGAAGGQSLPQLIASVFSGVMTATYGIQSRFRRRLAQLGWADEDAPQYTTGYHLRTPMCVISVDATCPAITPAILVALGDAQLRIGEVSYTANFDGLGVLDGSEQFDSLLFPKVKP